MSTMPSSGAVVFAKDMQRLAAFYEGLCGLNVVHAESDHIVLESGAVQIVVHAIPQRIARAIAITQPPVVREETPIKLFFAVPDLAQARLRAVALGGQLAPAAREWEARGFRACDGHDPEGNVIQLRQHLA
ncbi:hypothetical protein KW843_17510 [Acidovorax sp. sif1233]|nr:hypothetical protein [Acidovorax sp. sif0732]MBV7448799.1 hypothetical protein [Acidovorax sp. sif0715]MBV7456282.1 hypothetical protein [Acidovorax sp. sif1233]